MLEQMGIEAKKAAFFMGKAKTIDKNRAILTIGNKLIENSKAIIRANDIDVENAKNNQMSEALIDRLRLTKDRIEAIAEGARQVAKLDDPIGEVLGMKLRPNGLKIGQKRVPLGVVGIIYESRPNVTLDAFVLCFKAGNATILRGGSDAIHSNMAIIKAIQEGLIEEGFPQYAVQLIEDTSRETAVAFMKLSQYVDVLIPRGGAGLIKTVLNQALIPVIETGTGNCHVYVDETADIDMAVNIVFNAKTQRLGVCNACESLVVHESIENEFLKAAAKKLKEKNVELRGDEKACEVVESMIPAKEEDWGKEYLDAILSVKTVANIDEAISHINQYNTGHSETIVTNDYNHAEQFLNEVDAACVYVNASTRFTDGFEFGFGAEIGISTQKLHARGPMGLLALTTTKYIIYGDGQIR